jgi:hypothetical protein
MNRKRAYFLLGVHPGSSKSHIKKMYYKKALKCHPDKKGNTEEFQELKDAYEYLSNQKDPVIPSLFTSSIHHVLSMLDQSILISLYAILVDYKDVPPEVLETMRSLIPPILIIEPTLVDLLNQHVYLYTHNSKKYSIPMWHHELVYDDFIVLCKPNVTVEMDDENNIYETVTASSEDVFKNGLYIESISHKVDVSKLHIVPYQIYRAKSTIPKINETNVYCAADCASFIIHIYLF